MIRNRVSWSFGLMALLLTLGMAACGGNEPAPVVQPPAPPPAPPPFQPQAVEVALGESGNITLMTAEDGGFTLSGEKFESGGTVAAENGNMYILNLADGNWTAVYQAMEAMVTLGITEEVVTLTKAEDGTYWLGDALVTSGESTATAANGNMYTLSINDEGMWSATYQAVMTDVTLGITGDSVTLTRAEDGTYWLGDALVTSGMTMTMAMNGNEYTLSMNDEGMWSAMYIEPVQAVMLGEHGGSVMIKKSEDGSYWLGDVTVANGAVVTAANGNMYELMMDAEGMWSAAYQQVMVSVTLGITGEMASLVRAEDGSYWLGDALVTSGMTTTMSMNGNEYRLTMGAEGMWMAEYVPAMGTVMVGGSGITVPAMRDEAGTWTAVHPLTQETITLAEGGMITAVNALGYTNTYTLSSDGAGMWTASYVSVQQALALGSSGSSTVLVRAEDGTYWLGDALVTSGETTTMSENGNTYVLTMANGAWSAMFTPEEMAIAGTGLVATSREDQAGYDVAGGNITVTGTAAGQNVTVMEAGDPRPMYYRVWMADGALMGARTDRAIVDANTEFRTKGLGAKPRYNIDDRNTPTNEVNTKLSIAGESLSLSDLFDRGSASKAASAADGESGDFVNDAIDKLTDLRTEAELYAKYQADNPGNATEFDNNLERIARDAQTIINTIFDRDPADYANADEAEADYMGNAVSASLPTEDDTAVDAEYIRAVDTVRALTTLLDALSSQDAFVEATEAGNNGIFEGALGEDAAKKAFSANNSEYEVWFGSTAMTRYGAVVKKVRVGPDPDLADDDTYDADPSTSSTAAARYGMKFNFDGFDLGDTNDDGEITDADDSVGREDLGRLGAFSYATTPETARARLLPQAGGATYEGGTIAVTPGTTSARENQLYSGMMRIDVNFRRSSVFGRISELKDKDNQLWQYLDRDVAEIYLPQRFYTNVGLFGTLDGTDASESATIVYTDTHGFPLPTSENTRARFSGRFIGPDGAEITGAWSIGEAVDDIDTDTTGTQTDDPRDIIYGSFGVMRTGDRGIGVAPGEDTSNGGGAETVVIPAGGEIKDSNLRLGMYNEGGDDENEFGLVQIFSQAGASWKKSVDTKPTFVKLLVDEINKQRNVYEVFVSFGDDSDDRETSSNIGRQAAWSAINDAVRTYLFGTDTLYDADDNFDGATDVIDSDAALGSLVYPMTRTGNPDDDGALDQIDALLDALANKFNFADAFTHNAGGVFDSAPSENAGRVDPFPEDIDDNPNLDGNLNDLSDMFAERVSKTTVWTMSTDYTRFGIWFREQSNFAGDDALRHSVRGGENGAQPDGAAASPNAYGYSWLDQSSYRVDRPEQTYPGAGVATYTGKTLAILDNQAFEGDAEIKVTWAAVTTGTPDSTVLPKFSDLRNVGNGDPLKHVDEDDESWIVDEIAFLRGAGESLRVDHASDGALSIMAGGTDQQTVIARLSVTNRTGTTADNLDLDEAGAIIFAAKFVGESLDGPLGLTGYWNIPTFNQSGDDPSPTPTKGDLHGSFGADLTDFETIFQP